MSRYVDFKWPPFICDLLCGLIVGARLWLLRQWIVHTSYLPLVGIAETTAFTPARIVGSMEEGRLLVRVALPSGWKKVGLDRLDRIDLVDERGRVRGRIRLDVEIDAGWFWAASSLTARVESVPSYGDKLRAVWRPI